MTLRVACGLVEREGRALCARRSSAMSHPHKWEFPGGKIHDGESAEECLRPELLEELGVKAVVGSALPPVTYEYPTVTITLYPFLCTLAPEEKVALHEHDQAVWLPSEELTALEWAADRHIATDRSRDLRPGVQGRRKGGYVARS